MVMPAEGMVLVLEARVMAVILCAPVSSRASTMYFPTWPPAFGFSGF